MTDNEGYATFYYYNAHPNVRKDYYSEAEVIFGGHSILSIPQLIVASVTLITSLFVALPFVPAGVALGVGMAQALFYSGSITGLVTGDPSQFVNECIGEPDFDLPGLHLMKAMLSVFGAFGDFAEHLKTPTMAEVEICKKINSQTNFALVYKNENKFYTIQEMLEILQANE